MSYNEEITTLSLARPCERSEAIQRISELDYKWIATLTLAMTTTLQPSAETVSQLGICSNRLQTPFHSWEFDQPVCEHHFTAENLLKLSAETVSQWRICSNHLRTPFHSWEFAQTVCGHRFTVGNSAKISYFHPKIIFYSLIKKENDKHNKT